MNRRNERKKSKQIIEMLCKYCVFSIRHGCVCTLKCVCLVVYARVKISPVTKLIINLCAFTYMHMRRWNALACFEMCLFFARTHAHTLAPIKSNVFMHFYNTFEFETSYLELCQCFSNVSSARRAHTRERQIHERCTLCIPCMVYIIHTESTLT